MPSKYATTPNVRYDEDMRYNEDKNPVIMSHVRHSERGSVISDCLVTGSVMTSHVCHSEGGSVISDCLVTGSVMTS